MSNIFITKDKISGYFIIGHCDGTKSEFLKKYKYLYRETLILYIPHDNTDRVIKKIYKKLSNKRSFESKEL